MEYSSKRFTFNLIIQLVKKQMQNQIFDEVRQSKSIFLNKIESFGIASYYTQHSLIFK